MGIILVNICRNAATKRYSSAVLVVLAFLAALTIKLWITQHSVDEKRHCQTTLLGNNALFAVTGQT